MEPILPPFQAEVVRVTRNASQIPFISYVSGSGITAAQATAPATCARHLRPLVRCAAGIATLTPTWTRSRAPKLSATARDQEQTWLIFQMGAQTFRQLFATDGRSTDRGVAAAARCRLEHTDRAQDCGMYARSSCR